MIHYHGLPITPATAAVAAVNGGHAFVSFRHAGQLTVALECAQSFALDNGAFSAWMAGEPITDWTPYYEWVAGLRGHPAFDWAVVPDVIDGSDQDNDRLVREWLHVFGGKARTTGVPVWHMHEPLARLEWLAREWPRVAIGSSGEFAAVGDARWWGRMNEAMRAVCDDRGFPRTKLHGLRMLDPEVFSRLPFASADSTNIGRNVGIDSAWKGTYTPPTKEARALVMRQRIESINGASRWTPQPVQEALCLL